jgi:uncharacterized protein (DUF2141 family)
VRYVSVTRMPLGICENSRVLALWSQQGREFFEGDRSMRLPSRQGGPVAFARIGFSLGCLMLMDPGVIAGQTSSCPGIHVTILNIRNGIGTVDCALFDSPNGFPRDVMSSAMRVVVMKVPNTRARCDFEGLHAGTYALVVLHDENMNGKIDTNWLGVPKEGYGFSNDAKAAFRTPSFSNASFVYDGKTLDLTITLRY